jgi:subtilase family serine protease
MVVASLAVMGDHALFSSTQDPYGPLAVIQGSLPQPAGLKLGKAIAPDTLVAGGLSFSGTNPKGQVQLASEINNPSSPLYHHYLVGDQFNELFAPSASMQTDLMSYLVGYGLTVTVVTDFLWNVQGPASGMDAAFGTTIVSATAPGHAGFYPLTPLRLPSEFSGQVTPNGGFQTVDPPVPSELIRAPTLFHGSAPVTHASPNAGALVVNMTSPYIIQYQNGGPLAFPPSGMNLTWNLTITGGTAPYSVSWHWGDGTIQHFTTSAAVYPNFHLYYVAGQADYCYYTVCGNISVWVTDAAADNATIEAHLVPGISPIQAQFFYNLRPLYKLGDSGQGTTIGLDEMCDPSYSNYLADANSFSAKMGLPTFTTSTLDLMGTGASSCTLGSSGWSGETMLDIEWAHSMAPNATLDVDLADLTIDEGDVTWNTLSHGVYIDSNSWGSGSTYSAWTTAATQGQSYLTATGDCGSAGMTNAAPADSQYGVGVGGTQIYSYPSSVFRAEFAWNGTTDASGCSNDEGSTGGYATSITAPWYQVGMQGFSNAHRGIPDISAIGGTWVWMYDGGVTLSAGTSLACPSSAAMLDLMYQYNTTANKANGMADYDFYNIAKSPNYHIGFHDVTVGQNLVSGSGYTANPGWDAVTGLGSFNASQLAQLIAHQNGNAAPYSALTVVANANVTFGPANLAVNFGADTAGGPSTLNGYSYAWTFGDGGTATTAAYQTDYVYKVPGIYQASVTVTGGSSTSGTSNSITVHVTGNGSAPGKLSSVSVAPTAATIGVGGTTNFTATPTCTGGPCPAGITYTWTLTNSLGSLGASGSPAIRFTAGSTAGVDTMFLNASVSGVTKEAPPVPITIVPALATVSVSPTSGLVAVSSSADFGAIITCTGGSCPVGTAYSWNLTSVAMGSLNTSSGPAVSFTAGTTTGVVNLFVNATLSGITKRSVAVPITIATSVISLSTLTLSPMTKTLFPSQTQTFSTTTTCLNGSVSTACPPGLVYAWALTSTLGTITTPSAPSVTFTAGSSAGTAGLFVNATYNGVTKTSSAIITVILGSVLTGLSISPVAITLSTGGTQLFTTTVTCTLGKCPATLSYTWQLNNSDGNLSSLVAASSNFTAGNSPSIIGITVVATLNGTTAHATSTITVLASGPGQSSSSSNTLLLLVLLAVIAAVVVIAVVVVVMRRRKKRSAYSQPMQPWPQSPGPQYQGWQQPPPQYGYQAPPPQSAPYSPPPPGQVPPPPPGY